MDNKEILENTYRVSYDSAKKYVEQGNLAAAKNALKKALSSAIKLAEQSRGAERERYKKNAVTVSDLLESVNNKMDSAASAVKAKPTERKKTEEPIKLRPPEKPLPPITVEEALAKLNELEGLSKVKEQVKKLVAETKVSELRKSRSLKVRVKTHHLIFTGNPGTGKTTVARIMADIYRALGILSKGHLVEAKRADLIAGYVGQTAIKTQEVIDSALGGVLFIDEAYMLYKKDNDKDYGKEAIDTLLKALEDNRDDFVVIVAGYADDMREFFEANVGLMSRFRTEIEFENYNGEQMFSIFANMCKSSQYVLTGGAEKSLRIFFDRLYAENGGKKDFANARTVRNAFDLIVEHQDLRIAEMGGNISNDVLMTITESDLAGLDTASVK